MSSARIFIAAVVLLTVAIPALGQYSDPGPIGLANMERYDLLPYLWRNCQTKQGSSYDRTDDNIDRSNYVYQDNNEHTFIDVKGPGCIYRIWITSLDTTHQIRFYFDNDTTPRFAATIANLFSGSTSPFLSPLAGYVSGGYFIYLPMPFRERCRVTASKNSNVWFYYNVQYHTYPHGTNVTTWTGSENSTTVRNMWNSSANPNTTPNIDTVTGSGSVAVGSTLTFLDRVGPATINSVNIRIPQIIPNNATSDSILEQVRIRMYWDNETTPSVDAPIGEFFGCGLGEYTVSALPIKMETTSNGWYRCYFPMPFGSRARMQIYNPGPVNITGIEWDVRIGAMADAATKLAEGRVGYFKARAHSEYPTTTDKDYIILQTAGRGALVGCVVTMRGLNGDKNYLEGDERIHIDGNATPVLYGTGTEDFFNGGWYFKNGQFTRQVYGNPAYESGTQHHYTCYRYFLSDKIIYSGSIRVGLEHGEINNFNGNYTSVAYYYEVGPSGIKLSDELDVGKAASESSHSYTCTGQTWTGSLSLRYEGDDPTIINDDGRKFNAQSQFTVSIDPNNTGVKIRRRMDYTLAHQNASVYIDGVLAGTWYDAGSAASRWRDSDFDVPASLTAGKSSITVRIVSSSWSEFRYRIFSYVSTDTQAPGSVSNLSTASLNGQVQLSWTCPSDPDVKGVMVRYSTTGYPASPTDGMLAIDRPGWADTPDMCLHSGLTNGTTYYYSVFTYDGVPNYSVVAQIAQTPNEPTCGVAKIMPDGSFIALQGKVVTAIFGDEGTLYISEPNGTSGIRVVALGSGLALGDRVNVSGTMSTYMPDGVRRSERQIAGATVTKISSGAQIAPFAMKCLDVGGGFVPPHITGVAEGNGQQGVGTNNIGNLVKIVGKVTRVMGSYIYIDDGSDIQDILDGSIYRKGILVRCATTPIVTVGNIVSAVGVIQGSMPSGWTANRRFIRCRTSSDIRLIH